jgi:hypothetical protein
MLSTGIRDHVVVKTFARFSERCFAYSFSTGTRLQRVKYREIAFLLLLFLSRKFLAEKSISKITCYKTILPVFTFTYSARRID